MQQSFHTGEWQVTRRVRLNYVVYLPEAQDKANVKSPLLIFLHGRGERGDDPRRILIYGPPKIVTEGRELPFVILAPQCPAATTWPLQTDALNALLDEIIDRYVIDTTRVYLTGLSMGGFGTWNWAATNPERFAAIAPVCGGGDWLFDFPDKVCDLGAMPVWAFHGALDEVVPLHQSEVLVDALRACGGNVRFTIYPDLAHDSWTSTYNNPELYEWFLSQHRNGDRSG